MMEAHPVEKVGFTEIIIQERIGAGAYGTVFKATCNKLPCAAKKIHQALMEPQEGTAENHQHRAPFQRFEAEFKLLQELRHSNIIQYLGVYVDPETKLPVLLMELLDTNLTKYFEKNVQALSFHTQVNLCLDIMRALLFLHVNKIVHRDLSGGNILLIENPLKAKLSDFGMARFLNADVSRVTHTAAPGTLAYMPPEAFGDEFKESGDIFSFAVLLIQILTQKFPEPQGNRVADRIIENEKIQVLVKESERRRNHISLIREDHPLLPIALECLKNDEKDRPLASDLCDRLIELTDSTLYSESKEAEENPPTIVKEKESFEFSDYIFITDEEKLTHAQQALHKSEIENKGVKDILEAKLKVLDGLVERNDDLLKVQKQKQEIIEQKEANIQMLSNIKTENELKLKNLADEIKKHQQTINDQSDSFQKKIDEQKGQISDQLRTVAERDQKIKSDREQISRQLETISRHEDHINELSLQLEQQSAIISLHEEKIAELLSQIPAKKKKKQPGDDVSFFEKFKRTFTSANNDTHNFDETKAEPLNQDPKNEPTDKPTSPDTDATPKTPEPNLSLPAIETLKQADQMHKDSGLTEDIINSWDTINETDVAELSIPITPGPDEKLREKVATERLATASDNIKTTLNDIGKLSKNPQPSQKSVKKKNESQPGKKEHKPSTSQSKSISNKTPKKRSSSSKSPVKTKPIDTNPFDDLYTLETTPGLKTASAMKSREQSAIERMEESSARSVRTLTETYRLGVATSEDLAIQGEKLDGIERRHDEMNAYLTQGPRKEKTTKSSFARFKSSKKKKGLTPLVESTPLPKKTAAELPPAASATEQLRRLPTLGSAVIDENTERMSQQIFDLKSLATRQGEMLDRQNGQLGRIHQQADDNHAALAAKNKKMKERL